VRRRLLPWWLALAIVVLLHAVSAYELQNLHFNNSPEAYYPKDSPAVRLRDELRRHFPSDEILTVAFQGDDLYSADFLRRLDRVAVELQRHPLVDRVLTVTTMERISGSADGFAVGRLIDVNQIGRMTPAALKKRVLDDRFAPGALASRDGTTLAMAVRPGLCGQVGPRHTPSAVSALGAGWGSGNCDRCALPAPPDSSAIDKLVLTSARTR